MVTANTVCVFLSTASVKDIFHSNKYQVNKTETVDQSYSYLTKFIAKQRVKCFGL